MSRNGSGVYSLPAGSTVATGETIQASQHNTPLQDLETDMNTARPVVAGGTGASTASGARTNLGVAIGSDVQAYDAGLASIAGLTTAADKGIYTTSSDTYATFDLTSFGRSLVDDADAATARSTLGLGTIATQAASAVAVTGGAVDGTAVGGTTPAAGAFTTLSASGNVTFTGGTIDGIAIGGTTPAAGAFTTLSASGDVTFNTNTLFVDATNGLVGVGTVAPSYTFEVSGGSNFTRSTNSQVFQAENTNGSFTGTVFNVITSKAGASNFNLAKMSSNTSGTTDLEFKFRGDGNGTCDGSWTGGGADYAEYFEWVDGNPGNEDRRGMAVVIDNGKVRPAQVGEDPIGVVSSNPSVIGDGDMDRWKMKYLRDDFGAYIWENYSVTDESGATVTHQRRKLNPDFDPARPYTPREDRPEWVVIGLMGKLRLRKGQPTGARWIKMRDVSATVEEWLVR